MQIITLVSLPYKYPGNGEIFEPSKNATSNIIHL